MSRSPENFPPPEPEADELGRGFDDSSREAAEKAGGPKDFAAEIRREAESAKRGIAQAVWAEPARFAVAMSRESAGETKRFLEKFIGTGDDFLLTDELKRAREAVRAAVEPK